MNKIFVWKIINAFVLIIVVAIICFSVAPRTVFAVVSDNELKEFVGNIIDTNSLSREELETTAKAVLLKYRYSQKRIDNIFTGSDKLPSYNKVTGFGGGGTSGGLEEEETEFVPLAPIPGVTDKETARDTSAFFSGAFKLGITIAGFLAVIMIAVGGLQYMSTDTIGGKGEGRERITYAIMGLLLILFAWILLSTINPDIVSLRLFD